MRQCLFAVQKKKDYIMELYENKDISIMCPNCRKFLTKADSRDWHVHKLKCRKCHKWIWFKPSDDFRKVKEVPDRNSASGTRLY